MIRSLILALLLAMPAMAFAQTTAPITNVIVTVYRQGQTTPAVAPVTLPVGSFQFNQPVVAAPTGVVSNPTELRFTDPTIPTRDAVWRDAGGGVLTMLAADPTVTYEATARFVTSAGNSPESARSNLFRRPGEIPAAPAQPRVVSGS